MSAEGGPLAGVRVLDLSRVLAGPFAGQLLADYGAEVVKVERPGTGDDTRGWGPPFEADGTATYFAAANRNKRCAAIDIARPEGAAIVAELAKRSQILIENFRVGGLARYGLGYDDLAKENPALVYCSITGFGQTGPEARRAGYDALIQAEGGLMSITGPEGGEPVKVGVAVADLFTGLYAVTAILAVLREAEATGRGRHLDLALYDCQLAMLANQATAALRTGEAPGRLGSAHPSVVPYQAFETADGALMLAVGNDGQFRAFCEAAGQDALPDDPRFTRNRDRVANREALLAVLKPVLAARSTAAWRTALGAAGVPCGPVRSVREALASPQAEARGMVVEADGVRMVASPVKLGDRVPTRPPALGQHTAEVLEEIGIGQEETSALAREGVVAIS
jgi:crotonobetainyl-CoA:carnitine CoA-transferase CaiB-like acyl-CoA transferase